MPIKNYQNLSKSEVKLERNKSILRLRFTYNKHIEPQAYSSACYKTKDCILDRAVEYLLLPGTAGFASC